MSPTDTALVERPQWTPLAISPIESDDQYCACAEHLKTIKAYQKQVAAFFAPHKARAHEAWKALVAEEAKALAPADADEAVCKRALRAYDERKEEERAAEERRLRELARQQEEDRRLREAAALELAGETAEAAAVLEEPVTAPTVLIEKATPKVAGISYRETWSARLTSLPQLIAYVAAHPAHANLLTPNFPALNALARSLKTGMRIDGVEAVCTKTTAAGTR